MRTRCSRPPPAALAPPPRAHLPTSTAGGKRYNKETLTPFDSTLYKGAGRAGQHPHLVYRAEPEEEAFSVHVRTARRDPAAFTLGGQGLGGTANRAAAAAAAAAKAAHRATVAPPAIKVRHPAPATARAPRALPPLTPRLPRAPLPPQATAKRLNPPNSELRRYYERSDLPCVISNGKLKWRVDLLELDFHHYLPLFCSGLREVEEPYRFIAEEGVVALIAAGGERKVLPVVPQLVLPIKDALITRDERVILRAMRALSALADLGPAVGAALVPFYRPLLPPLNVFMGMDVNLGDGIDYGQRFGHFGEKITECLQKLELHGGPDALVNLKYCLPKYESALMFG